MEGANSLIVNLILSTLSTKAIPSEQTIPVHSFIPEVIYIPS